MRIAAIVIIGLIAIGGTVFLTAEKPDKQLEDLKASNAKLVEYSERLHQLQQEAIQKHLGSDYLTYLRCHRDPPATKEHQQLCVRIDQKLARKEAELKAFSAKAETW